MGIGKGNLLQTVGVVGGRSTFEVDGAIGQQWNSGRRRYRIEFDRELVELELVLHGIDDLVTYVDRKDDRLLVVIEIGKWNRRVAVADGDGAGFLDFFERPREFLGIGLPGTERGGERKTDHTQAFHSFSPRDECAVLTVWTATEQLPAAIRQAQPLRRLGQRMSRQPLHRLVGIRI